MQDTITRGFTVGIPEEKEILKNSKRPDREFFIVFLIAVGGIAYFCIMLLPIWSLFGKTGIKGIIQAVGNVEVLASFGISFYTSAITVLIVFLVCTPAVFLVFGFRSGKLSGILEVASSLPSVLPPAVAGIALLMAFGRNGLIGSRLEMLGIQLVFTPAAVVIAQIFVSAGFYMQVLRTSLDKVEKEIFEVSYVMGAGKAETFVKVILPLLKKPVAAGLILAWTRALGEFGATIMFAGNVAGKTRSAPLEIYTLMQTDITTAAAASALMLLITFLMLLAVKLWLKD